MDNSKDLAPLDEKDSANKTPGLVPTPVTSQPPATTTDEPAAKAVANPTAPKAGGLVAGAGDAGHNTALGRPLPPRAKRAPVRRKRTNPWNWVLVILLAVGAGVGAYYYTKGTQTNPAFQGQTFSVTNRNPVTTSFSSNGQVQANADLGVNFSASGTVKKLDKKLGDTVKAGEVIAQLDETDLKFALQTAQSQYDQQLASYKKSTEGATQKDLEVAQAQVDSARASLEKTIKGSYTAQDVAAANAAVNSAAAKLAQTRQGGNPQDIIAAQAAITSAEAQLASAKAKLAKTRAGSDNAAIVSAQTTYDQAVASYDRTISQLQLNITTAEVNRDKALNALKTAQEKYATIYNNNRDSSGKIKDNVAQSAIDNETVAYRTMQDAQGDYNRSDISLNDARIQLDGQKRSLQSQIENARAQLDKAKSGPTAADVAADEASVLSAQASLDNAKKSLVALTPTAAQIAADESSLASAQANLLKLRGGTPEEITMSESSLKSAEATLNSLKQGPNQNDLAIAKAQLDVSQTNLDKAKLALENVVLKSPINGVIVSAPLKEGQIINNSTVIYQIVDMSSLHIDVNVGESDIGKIKEGMAVAVNLDSIPGRSYTGKVSFISSKSTVSNNVVNYLITVTLDPEGANSLFEAFPGEFDKYQQALLGGRNGAAGAGGTGGTRAQIPGNIQLPRGATAQIAAQTGVCGYSFLGNLVTGETASPKVGMSANVTFCQSLKAGVLSVPNRAIKNKVEGNQRISYVQVLVNRDLNIKEDRPIVVGSAGDNYTEITGGNLKEGDVLVLTETTGARTTTTGTQTNNLAIPGAAGGGGAVFIGGGGGGGGGGR